MEVLKRVDELALKQKQPIIGTNFKYNWKYDLADYGDPPSNIEVEEEVNRYETSPEFEDDGINK